MKKVTINSVKVGQTFQLSENGALYTRLPYCRINKKYPGQKWNGDISNWYLMKSGRMVLVDEPVKIK